MGDLIAWKESCPRTALRSHPRNNKTKLEALGLQLNNGSPTLSLAGLGFLASAHSFCF